MWHVGERKWRERGRGDVGTCRGGTGQVNVVVHMLSVVAKSKRLGEGDEKSGL